MIDHHENPENFADLNFSFPEISSTCEIVYNIIYSLDSFFINKDIATCLYTGIMTDTGSFKYPSTTSKTHKIISKLIEYGANGSKIYEKIYDEFSLNKLKLLSICLNNIRKIEKLPIVYMTLNQKELDNCYFKKGDSEGFVNYGLSIKGIKLSIILIENKDEKIIKMSFRSKGNFSTNLFAEKFFNGGGHANASGGSSKESLKTTISKLLIALNDFNYEF
jgi:phosphoesterase RecJ-like protein